jgi:hypothetical protein
MKWRPISELSDKQRDGRGWVFKKLDQSNLIAKWVNNSWAYDDDDDTSCYTQADQYDYFLSEPLPDLPKPQKMEWRKFEDEMPEEESNILIMFDNKKYMVYTNFDSRVLSIAGPEKAEYWMPIIPPEGN